MQNFRSQCHTHTHPTQLCPPEQWQLIWENLGPVLPECACQILWEDRWHAEIDNLTQHPPFCEQMNLLWQYVYERLSDLLSSHLNILSFPPQAHCYLWQLGPVLLCALMFNSRTHNQAGRGAWVCWELIGSCELRNSDFFFFFSFLHECSLCNSHWSFSLLHASVPGLKMWGRRSTNTGWDDTMISIRYISSMTFLEISSGTPTKVALDLK